MTTTTTSSFAGSGDRDVRCLGFLFRPCSGPVFFRRTPGCARSLRVFHIARPLYRDLQARLRSMEKIFGFQEDTLKQAEHHTRKADQIKLAEAAMHLLDKRLER